MRVTRQEYIKELEALQHQVVLMGDAAAAAVKKAMQAFMGEDKRLAQQVMEQDDIIDDMIVDVEDRCILLIAKQQPIARDLRVIATGFKISTDLERIGDHAFDIAKATAALDLEALQFKYTPQLAQCAVEMVEGAIKAYEGSDIQLAESICRRDDEMDELFGKTFLELSNMVTNEADKARQITQLLFIARFLERIGDHATNIAEWVIYLETAERIRKVRTKA